MKKHGAKRSVVATITTLSIVALLLVSLTVAFLTDSRSTLNILGIGTDEDDRRAVQIALLEEAFGTMDNAIVESANTGIDYEYTKVTVNDLLPGDKVNKDSTVKNVGNHPVYVRIQLTNEAGDIIDLANPANLVGTPYEHLTFAVTDSWYYDSFTQAYYYYEDVRGNTAHLPLAPDASLPVFVTSQATDGSDYTIEISNAIDNDDLEALANSIDIKVKVDAIQAQNFEPALIDGASDPWHGEEILEVTGRY